MLSQTQFSNTQADDATVGTLAWSNVSYIAAHDTQYATRVMNGTAITHYLKATNFAFTLPSTATVLGIFVEIERQMKFTGSPPSDGDILDSVVKIVKADGTLGATNKGFTSVPWSLNGDEVREYGADDD